MRPLLTICIPTYNRADFLKVMLEALLPQVAKVDTDVEVWVLDNASEDNTEAIVESSRHLGPFNYHRNKQNLGPIINVIEGPVKLAAGTFTWVLGDHNLLRGGALKRVLAVLRENLELSVFYANFRCATYPKHWPDNALGGFDGAIDYFGNSVTQNHQVPKWWQLLQGGCSAYCTQVYAHIVRKEIWLNFWEGKSPGKPFSSTYSTYPHTAMIAETLWNTPSFYIGEPVLTIFNGAQSWGDPDTRLRANSLGFPGLIKLFSRQGWSQERTAIAKKWGAMCLGETLEAKFSDPNERYFYVLFKTLFFSRSALYMVPVIIRSFMNSECCTISRVTNRYFRKAQQLSRYLFRDCRPARWLRRSRN